jgi:hypothetical protein
MASTSLDIELPPPETKVVGIAAPDSLVTTPPVSEKPPVGHPDYEFPKEVHNLLVTAQTGHIALSAMADSKASILMGATLVVFSLTIGQITSEKATASLLLLGAFSFLATVLSIMAIRPKLTHPPATIQPGANILFFGCFAGLPQEEFIDHVIDVLRSEEATYRAMARDLYQNGQVLHRKKYRYLSYAYSTFLVGFMATLIAFTYELLSKHYY